MPSASGSPSTRVREDPAETHARLAMVKLPIRGVGAVAVVTILLSCPKWRTMMVTPRVQVLFVVTFCIEVLYYTLVAAAAILKTRRPNIIYTAGMPTSADSKNNCVANGSPVTHQTLRQQGGTGEDSYIHLADWTRCYSDREEEELLFLLLLGRFSVLLQQTLPVCIVAAICEVSRAPFCFTRLL